MSRHSYIISHLNKLYKQLVEDDKKITNQKWKHAYFIKDGLLSRLANPRVRCSAARYILYTRAPIQVRISAVTGSHRGANSLCLELEVTEVWILISSHRSEEENALRANGRGNSCGFRAAYSFWLRFGES